MAIVQPLNLTERVYCPRCMWRGTIAEADMQPHDVVRCPECGTPTLTLHGDLPLEE